MRALFIDTFIPSSADSGRLDSLHYISTLHDLGFEVELVTMASDPNGINKVPTRHVALFRDVDSAKAWLKTSSSSYEVIFVCRIDNYVKLREPLTEFRASGGRLIFVTVDLHHLREFRLDRVLEPSQREAPLALAKRAVLELELVREADATIVVSHFEKLYLSAIGIEDNVWHIPLGRKVASQPARETSDEPEVTFIGSFGHLPNKLGLEQFLEDLWPIILKAVPDALLHVAGVGSEILRVSNRPRLIAHGWVDHLEPLYGRSWATIAPIQAGAGLKGKVIDSLANGVPVLGSRTALEGMPTPRPKGALTVCENADDYVQALSSLRDRRHRLDARAAALAYASDNFSLGLFRGRLSAMLSRLLEH